MRIVQLYISPEHNFIGHHGRVPGDSPMQAVDAIDCVAGRGIRGDRFFDFKEDYKGQVTFFSHEVYERMCEQFSEYGNDAGAFRRNIITRDADLNALIGKEFDVQGVRFVGVEESKPCYWMNTAFAEGAEEALNGNGGLRARILSDGTLRLSDSL